MKRTSLALLVFCVCYLNSFAQETQVVDSTATENSSNNILAIATDTIAKDVAHTFQFSKVFETSLTTNDDKVVGGSAASYTLGNTAHSLSANYAISGDKMELDSWMFNAGIVIKGDNNGFLFYKRDTWSNTLTFRLGADRLLKSWSYTNKATQTLDEVVKDELTKTADSTLVLSTNNTESEAFLEPIKDTTAIKPPIKITNHFAALWVNATAHFGYTTFGIDNDAILKDSNQDAYTGVFKPAISASLYFYKYGSKATQFAQFRAGFTWGNTFDSPLYNDMNFQLMQSQQGFDLYNENGHYVQPYSDLKKKITYVDLGLQYTNFCFFDAVLGLTASTNFNFPVNNNITGSYKPNYSALAGVAIKINHLNSWTAATISLTGGVEDTMYSEIAFDGFVAKLGIAVPFSIFKKR